MKQILFALLGFLMVADVASAQEDGTKLAKSAGKALTSYNIDPANNGAKLDEAKTKIDQALQTADAQAIAQAWITKGDVYSTILARDMAKRQIPANATMPLTDDNGALTAFEAYKKGFDIATKKFEKTDAIKGISGVQGDLINIGSAKYEAGEYEKAYYSFQASLASHEMLKGAAEKSLLDDPKAFEEQVYYTAYVARLAKRNPDALTYYDMLYKQGTTRPGVYEGIYEIKKEMSDLDGAKAILEEGRKKFPDDSALLFAEINSYLASGKLSELTDRLKLAITKEPDNIGLYVTLGNVYDNLYQAALKDKNEAKTTEYFNEAKKVYGDALAKDPKNADATYAMGALYYNKAAFRTQELMKMPEDFSAAGQKKYDAANNEIKALFEEALPFFQKAEKLNPNDVNTLIALSEIYARKGDEAVSAEFKKRVTTVQEGKKNAESYFKN